MNVREYAVGKIYSMKTIWHTRLKFFYKVWLILEYVRWHKTEEKLRVKKLRNYLIIYIWTYSALIKLHNRKSVLVRGLISVSLLSEFHIISLCNPSPPSFPPAADSWYIFWRKTTRHNKWNYLFIFKRFWDISISIL